MGLACALFTPKPPALMKRIATLRELGHTHERYSKPHKKAATSPKSKGQRNAPHQQPSASTKESISSSTQKEKAVELKGIPESILQEQRKAKKCFKCGKTKHSWLTIGLRSLIPLE